MRLYEYGRINRRNEKERVRHEKEREREIEHKKHERERDRKEAADDREKEQRRRDKEYDKKQKDQKVEKEREQKKREKENERERAERERERQRAERERQRKNESYMEDEMDLLDKIDCYTGTIDEDDQFVEEFIDEVISEAKDDGKGQWVRTLIGLGVLKPDGKGGLKKTGKKVSDAEVKKAMKERRGGKEQNDKEQSGGSKGDSKSSDTKSDSGEESFGSKLKTFAKDSFHKTKHGIGHAVDSQIADFKFGKMKRNSDYDARVAQDTNISAGEREKAKERHNKNVEQHKEMKKKNKFVKWGYKHGLLKDRYTGFTKLESTLLNKIDLYTSSLNEDEFDEMDLFIDELVNDYNEGTSEEFDVNEEASKYQYVRTLIGLGVLKKVNGRLVKTGKKVTKRQVIGAMRG